MWLFLLACTPDSPPTSGPVLLFPDPFDLPESAAPPEVLIGFADGAPVNTVAEWETTRRPELLALFAHYVYGVGPEPVTAEVQSSVEAVALGGLADLVVIEAQVSGVPFQLTVLLPADRDGPVPVVLGLNKCGTHSIDVDPALPLSPGFVEASCDSERGSRSSYWNLEAALSQGVAVATVHQSDFAPDDADSVSPLREALAVEADPGAEWATIGAWSYGLIRAIDVLWRDDRIGEITVFGHSRRGKTALWTGALDPRVDRVWAHQSGTAGATLSRSFNGEPVAAMNLLFPHWFPANFHAFGDREQHLPVDQHMLLALIAPRPLLVTDGDADLWADPDGASEAVSLAGPVFDLYGAAPPERVIRPGGHEVRPSDWDLLLSTL